MFSEVFKSVDTFGGAGSIVFYLDLTLYLNNQSTQKELKMVIVVQRRREVDR